MEKKEIESNTTERESFYSFNYFSGNFQKYKQWLLIFIRSLCLKYNPSFPRACLHWKNTLC